MKMGPQVEESGEEEALPAQGTYQNTAIRVRKWVGLFYTSRRWVSAWGFGPKDQVSE